jgi:hypothetical protein
MEKLPFYLAGAGAGALTGILDLFKDHNNGTVARVGRGLREHLFGGADLLLAPTFWAIVLIVVVSLFLCWVFEVTSRLDGFLRGCTILAAFSIGAPEPLINKHDIARTATPAAAPTDGRGGNSSWGVSSAFAQAARGQPKADARTGEVYVTLRHLTGRSPIRSTISVQDFSSRKLVELFQIEGDKIEITQPYGQYLVEVQTPGFATTAFSLTINEPVLAYKANVSASSVPLAVQKLITPSRIDLTVDDAEKYKQLGRKRRMVGDFDGAIANYKLALEADPSDPVIYDYLGYALFRQGKYADAARALSIAIARKPEYKWSFVNMIKVNCAERKLDKARRRFTELRAQTDIWKSDGELQRVCGAIVN